MQRYFCVKKDLDIFELNKENSYHAKTVMRMKLGSRVEVVYQDVCYLGEIISLDEVVKVRLIKKKDEYNELDTKVTICQSLVKEEKMDLVLQKGVELGAYSFIPLRTRNSVIKINDDTKKVVRWQKIVNDASRQAKRNIIPEVFNIMNLEDITKLNYDLKILCTVNELSMSLKNILQNNKKCGTMIIVIGPEGGFKKDEEDYLISHGFISTRLLDFVLRTETASIVALSMINYEYTR